MTDDQISCSANEAIRQMSSSGGTARAEQLSLKRLKEIASAGGSAKWKGVSKAERSRIMKAVRAAGKKAKKEKSK